MQKPESKIRTQIKKYVEDKYKGLCFVHHGGPYSERGVADIICVLPEGRACFLEVKVPGKSPRPDQTAWLSRYATLGAISGFVTCVQDVDNIIQSTLDKA